MVRATRNHGTIVPSLIALALVAGGAGAQFVSGRVPGQTPFREPDSRRLEPAELEQLLAGSASNTRADTAVTVEGNPVLTDQPYLQVTPADFTPHTTRDPREIYELCGYFWFDQGWVFGYGNHENTQAIAPVKLPEGVTVVGVSLLAVDDSPDSLSIQLFRANAFVDAVDGMAGITTHNTDTSDLLAWSDSTIANPVIQNGIYQYGLYASGLSTQKRIRSVVIQYTH